MIEKLPIPDVQPLAMAYCEATASSPEHWLFVAGGTHGLFAYPLCPALVNQGQPCGSGGWVQIVVEPPIEGGYFERKRCVDVVVDKDSVLGVPMIHALFAASSNPGESAIHGTELRTYKIASGTISLVASMTFPDTLPSVQAGVGSSLALDPADHDTVYVALGKQGIRQVDVVPMPTPHYFVQLYDVDLVSTATPNGDSVRDLAIVRTTMSGNSKAFLYAALNYGRVLECDLVAGTAQNPVYFIYDSLTVGCGFPEQISASVRETAEGGKEVFLALAVEGKRSITTETLGPYTVNGLWVGPCLHNQIDDPDAPPGLAKCTRLRLYRRDLAVAQPVQSTLVLASMCDFPDADSGMWNRVSLPSTIALSDTSVRWYASSTWFGLQVFDYPLATMPASFAPSNAYLGKAFGAVDATVSLTNPGVVRFSQESAGDAEWDGHLAYIDTGPTPTISLIPQTRTFCPGGYAAQSCTISPCAPTTDPQVFAGSISGGAHWIEPGSGGREWYISARNSLVRFHEPAGGGCACTVPADCSGQWNPCSGSNPSDVFYKGQSIASWPSRIGWQLAALTMPPAGMPANGPALQPRWAQLVLPPASPPAGQSEPVEIRANTVVYHHSTLDPRGFVNGYPRAVYCATGGTSHGLAVFRPEELVALATSSCGGTPGSWPGGFGERLDESLISSHNVLTHVELERSLTGGAQCALESPCHNASDPPEKHARSLHNNRGKVFRSRDLSGAASWVLALASGFTACTQSTEQGASPCLWNESNGRALLLLFDVTATGATGTFAKPELLRVCLGKPGFAWAVETKTYGTGTSARTYAFVADILGRLDVFDVSSDVTFPAASTPYLPATDVVEAAASMTLPKDPHDGQLANCLDLEVLGDYLYCALSRHGIGIVDIADPLNPILCAVLDTPGLAEGLAIRTVTVQGVNHVQLIVSDSRGGVRVFE